MGQLPKSKIEQLKREKIEFLTHTRWFKFLGFSIKNPDICYEKDSGPWNVLPDTIGLSDNEDEFFITFATYCEAPTSNNGENIYTDTLIDILEYLENYRNKL